MSARLKSPSDDSAFLTPEMAQAHARPPENTVQVPGGTAPIVINVFQGNNSQLPAVVVEQKPEGTKVVAILEGTCKHPVNTSQSKQDQTGKVNGNKRQRTVPDVIEILDSDDEESDKGKGKKAARPSRSVAGLNNASRAETSLGSDMVGPGGSTQPFGARYGSGSAWGCVTYWRTASAPPHFASPARTATYTTSASVSRSSTPFGSATASAPNGTATLPASTPVRQLSRSVSVVSTETTSSIISDSNDATIFRAGSDDAEAPTPVKRRRVRKAARREVKGRRLEPCPSVEV
ncbi:hypothetical protein K474DRAFT_1767492 [Panus rudis PR-1116 ss-1]|nr:hypothetical protein K474DRAFT_1767492 [Panus rudis PR-1116 ss-1]